MIKKIQNIIGNEIEANLQYGMGDNNLKFETNRTENIPEIGDTTIFATRKGKIFQIIIRERHK